MKKTFLIGAALLCLIIFSCKKGDKTLSVHDKFVGDWAGALQVNGAGALYKFSMLIKSDNTLINIDSAFSNQNFPGTYTFTTDSLLINYNNGTKWKLRFSNNYTNCSGTFLGYSGSVGTVSMTKK